MEFELTNNKLEKISADIVAVPVFEGKNEFVNTETSKKLDLFLNGDLTDGLHAENFIGKKNTLVSLRFPKKVFNAKIIVFGLGKKEDFTADVLRIAYSQIAKMAVKKVDSLAASFLSANDADTPLDLQATVLVEGLMLGSYSFTKYKEKDKNERDFSTIIISHDNKKDFLRLKKSLDMAKLFCRATYMARNLVNEQAAVATPTLLAKTAQDIARGSKNVSCKIFEKTDVEKMGMEAFLGVARGSDTPPKFIYLKYTPGKKSKKRLAIVGKGITFDTGGINLKPEWAMGDMKMDMSGAATVLGVFSVIGKIQPPFEVLGIIAATPNLISGKALVPGDVVRAMNGKTIEINNTDAEGRVTLADSLSFAVKEKATEIIDLATLTGACMVALGTDIAGLMTNDSGFAKKVQSAAYSTGEKVWELPLPDEYKDMNKSEVADISNLPTGRWAGAIAGGMFLREFVNNTPWVHLDIAGPAFAEKGHLLGPKGGTGYGVRLLLNLIKELGGEK